MKKRWLLALSLTVLTLFFLALVAYQKWTPSARDVASAPLIKSTVATTKAPPAFIRSLRPIYPYSVIPGGAYSSQELRLANSKDSVVRAHYADFNLKNAWIVKLTAERFQYASYRIQNQIYWTAKKLRIPQGEYLLTDGFHFARARCGNRLSEEPQGEISALEPPAAMLTQADFRPNLASNVDLSHTPAEVVPHFAPFSPEDPAPAMLLEPSPELLGGTPSVRVGPSPFIGTGGGISGFLIPPSRITLPQPPIDLPPSGPPPVNPSPVPEPASIYLFLIVFMAVLWTLARALAKEQKSEPAKPPKPSLTDDLD